MSARKVVPPRAAVIGLGLVGGSLARDLAALGWRVLAHDRDAASLDAAIAADVVHEPIGDSGEVRADVILLAVPQSAFAAVLREAAPRLSRAPLVMDVCSTKRSAIAAAEAVGLADRFVGAHPMAGGHRSGWGASRRGLFEGAVVYLCRTRATSFDALDRARRFWTTLGADTRVMTPHAHDQLVGHTSHLPQVASRALALTLKDAGVLHDDLGAGGRDVTRLAGGDATLWTAIMLDNADVLLQALQGYERWLRGLRMALERHDERSLQMLLVEAKRWSEADDHDSPTSTNPARSPD